MAVKINDEVTTPQSTGSVEFDGNPVESSQVADNTSTGAVAYEAPGETVASHWDAEPEVRVSTPTEPFTMSVGWLSEDKPKVQAKVVEPAAKKAPAKKTSRARTKG